MCLLEQRKNIPDDWINCELGEVLTLQRGYDLPHRLRKDGKVPIISSSGVSGWHDKAMVSPPGVVTGRYGTIGEIFYVNEPFWPLNTTLYVRDFRGMTAEYAYHFLKTINFESHSGKSGVPGVNRNDVHKEIVYFPINQIEQTAIVNILNDTDMLISELEKLIAKKQAIKSAAMQQLLTGRTRLSQFAKHSDGTLKGFTSSELGLIPEDWILSPLSQMGHVLRGVSYNGSRDLYPHDTDDSVRLFRSNNVYNSKIDLANLQYVTKSRVAYHQLMNSGDILICMANGSKNLVGKAAFYNVEDGHEYTFGAFMGVFRTFSEVESLYVFYLLTSDRCRSYIDLALAGSSINNLKPSDIEQFTFALPNSEEQKAIVTILSDMDSELEALEKKLTKTLEIKQGMMQQLLTGRIRLPLDQQS